MSLNLEQKQEVVAEVQQVLATARTAVLAEYAGLSVAQMTALRQRARAAGVYVRVVKNTLTRRAIEGSDFECLKDDLHGPLAFAASEDPVAVARVLSSFAKENDLLRLKVGALAGALLSRDEIDALARLPGREELLAHVVATMQAPVQRFVQTLNEVPARFVRLLAAVRDSREPA